jgi:hypothetical protein
MWPLLILLLASMAALGAYLGKHGFRHDRWGGYAVLYAAGVAGGATWTQWAGLTQSIRFELVFGFVLIGAALWGMALFDVVSGGDASLGRRIGYLIFLLLIPPYGVIDWAIDRTEGRLRAEIIGLTLATSTILLGMFALDAWSRLHDLPVVSFLPL